MQQQEDCKNRLTLEDRQYLVLEGVEQVGKFNEQEINLATNMGLLKIRGQELHITQLNLESGHLTMVGLVNSLEFSQGRGLGSGPGAGKGMLQRIFK